MSEETWPPPANAATQWHEVVPFGSRDRVKVREVMLWGKRVSIDADNRVWCPSCLDFRTVEQLGKHGNGCPVGIIRPSGTISRLDPGDDGPGATPRYRFLDLMRQRW